MRVKNWMVVLLIFVGNTMLLAEQPEGLKLKGKLYFDLYYIPATATNIDNSLKNGEFANLVDSTRKNESDNRYGFQIRRIYVTIEKKISEKFLSRVRVEMGNKSYKLNPDKSLIPFIKDAYLKYRYLKNHSVVFGISAPPTLNLYEERLWGYRAVEKVPEDLYKLRSSRDFGIALKGSFGSLKYNFMFGNGKGSATEDQTYKETKTAYLGLSYFFNKNLFVELYGDADIVPVSTKEKYTFHFLLGYSISRFRTGIQYIYQDLATPKYINIISVPFIYNLSDKISVLARLDNRRVYIPAQKQTTGVISDNFVIIGVDYKITKGVSFIPNIEIARYTYEKNTPEESITDLVTRFTIYYKF